MKDNLFKKSLKLKDIHIKKILAILMGNLNE
jgi:hypothetical protein